jgi:hypothetical protein
LVRPRRRPEPKVRLLTQPGPEAAKSYVKAMRAVFKWACHPEYNAPQMRWRPEAALKNYYKSVGCPGGWTYLVPHDH